MSNQHEIVILGAHYAGLNVAHYLLRHVIPKLSTITPDKTYHITIVSPNTKCFFNIAAPRHLVSESLVPENKIFLPIADAFTQYKPEQYSFVVGKAVGLDPERKVVEVLDRSDKVQDLRYDSLVIATGATFASTLWQTNESDEVTTEALSSVRKQLQGAQTVLISGGGATGVETAGEIAVQFPNIKTTLLSGSTRLLAKLPNSVSNAAETKLKALGVEVVHLQKVKQSTKSGNGEKVLLQDGTEKLVDVFIDATGGKANTSFLPPAWLDSSDRVLTDATTMRLTPPGTKGIYAIGDVASYSNMSLIAVTASVAPVATSIGIDIAAAAGNKTAFTQKLYKPMNAQLVPIGPSGGVGQVMGWKIPSLMVYMVKSKSFFVEKAEGYASGAEYIKA